MEKLKLVFKFLASIFLVCSLLVSAYLMVDFMVNKSVYKEKLSAISYSALPKSYFVRKSYVNNVYIIMKDIRYDGVVLRSGHCSGVIVGRDVLLTAGHCVHGFNDLHITYKGEGYDLDLSKVITDGKDHALIKIKGANFNKFSIIKRSHSFEYGQRVFCYSNPGYLKDIYTEGYISGYYNDLILMDLMVFPGSSGAAIYNDESLVIALVNKVAMQYYRKGAIAQWEVSTVFEFTVDELNRIGAYWR